MPCSARVRLVFPEAASISLLGASQASAWSQRAEADGGAVWSVEPMPCRAQQATFVDDSGLVAPAVVHVTTEDLAQGRELEVVLEEPDEVWRIHLEDEDGRPVADAEAQLPLRDPVWSDGAGIIEARWGMTHWPISVDRPGFQRAFVPVPPPGREVSVVLTRADPLYLNVDRASAARLQTARMGDGLLGRECDVLDGGARIRCHPLGGGTERLTLRCRGAYVIRTIDPDDPPLLDCLEPDEEETATSPVQVEVFDSAGPVVGASVSWGFGKDGAATTDASGTAVLEVPRDRDSMLLVQSSPGSRPERMTSRLLHPPVQDPVRIELEEPCAFDAHPVPVGAGLVLASVSPGSPFWDAGLRAGDRVLAIDGDAPPELPRDELTLLLLVTPSQPIRLQGVRWDGERFDEVVACK